MKPRAPHSPNRDLLKARIRAGMSADALGFQANISGKHVRQIERGYAWPSDPTAKAIADALSVPDVLELFPLERRPHRRRKVAA